MPERNKPLLAFRIEVEKTWSGDLSKALFFSILPETPFGFLAETPEEDALANRVLTRLANIYHVEIRKSVRSSVSSATSF